MRKIVLTGVAALGFLAIGMTVFGQPATSRLADAEGAGVDVQANRHLVAMAGGTVAAGRAQSLLVADARTASVATRTLLV